MATILPLLFVWPDALAFGGAADMRRCRIKVEVAALGAVPGEAPLRFKLARKRLIPVGY